MDVFEKKNTNGCCSFAAVYVLVNTILVCFMILWMAQQQREITNLRGLLANTDVRNSLVDATLQQNAVVLEESNSVEMQTNELMKEEQDINLEINNVLSRHKRGSKVTCRCEKGRRGKRGPKGDQGEQGAIGYTGVKGHRGRRGYQGDKGDKGDIGIKGMKGSIGPPGPMAPAVPSTSTNSRVSFVAHSAHIIGIKNGKRLSKLELEKTLITDWTQRHTSGMRFRNGYIIVESEGFYYVYSQMYYYALNSSFMGHTLNIDDNPVLAGYSNDGAKENLNTKYIGGVFHLKKGQKISISTAYTLTCYFDSSSSYFGAFMIHPVSKDDDL